MVVPRVVLAQRNSRKHEKVVLDEYQMKIDQGDGSIILKYDPEELFDALVERSGMMLVTNSFHLVVVYNPRLLKARLSKNDAGVSIFLRQVPEDSRKSVVVLWRAMVRAFFRLHPDYHDHYSLTEILATEGRRKRVIDTHPIFETPVMVEGESNA